MRTITPVAGSASKTTFDLIILAITTGLDHRNNNFADTLLGFELISLVLKITVSPIL
jgi:hypothetical protein